MNNEIVISRDRNLTAVEVQAQVNLVQKVMKQVMKAGVHYGKPFKSSKKQTLLKPGAEKLCMTFRIAPEYDIEDLSTDDAIRYRIKCKGIHIPSSMELGYGVGECSSDEDKYKWRGMICQKEYDATSIEKKRIKYKKDYGKIEEIKQVRTEIADIANTILKMCKKRALVDMVLTVTAASDLFDQDIEDLPEHLMTDKEDIKQEDMPEEKKETQKKQSKPEGKEPQTKEEISQKAYLLMAEIMNAIGSTEEEIIKECSSFQTKDKDSGEEKTCYALSIENLLTKKIGWLKSTYGKIKKMHKDLGLNQ